MTTPRTFLILLFIGFRFVGHCQTGEFTLGFPNLYFDTTDISKHSIKTIYHKTLKTDSLITERKAIYTFDKNSNLLCGESYYYDSMKKQLLRLTIDCYEYSKNGFQISHKRYHTKTDSAEWIQYFKYEVDDRSRIIKIYIEDVTNPENSHIIDKLYSTNGELVKEVADYGWIDEYIYDKQGRLVEETSTSGFNDSKSLYSYNEWENSITIKYEEGRMDNYDPIEVTKLYNDNGNLIKIESVYANGEMSYVSLNYNLFSQLERKEYYNSEGILESYSVHEYLGDLPKAITLYIESEIILKEIFDYEFFMY